MKWTKEQQQAICEKGNNILVAAAAGSGKTAVLVERIINKIIKENIDIDKILVVTFTNAAASEMRERVLDAIYKKLEEDPNNENLQTQINLLGKASICTIDSFCLEIVRNNFYQLEGISPNFRIADITEIELLKQEVLEEIFEKKYEEESKEFTKLIHTYTSYRDDTPLKDLILKIYNYIQSNPFPEKWLQEKIDMFNLENKINEDFSKTSWGKILLQDIEDSITDVVISLEKAKKDLSKIEDLEPFEHVIRDDIEKLNNLKCNLNNWNKAFEISQNLVFTTWSRKKVDSEIKDRAKEIRDESKKKIKKVIDKILICNSEEANQDIQCMYVILDNLQNIIKEFSIEFSKRKREKNIVDFNDIEHFALQILLKEDENKNIVPTEIAKQYQNKFQEIAIDEYQDSNLVQEYILTAVSKQNNIFMVGDVKQSIYKFRQAMPELFLSKYHKYKKKDKKSEKDDLKIQLFKNFRSRKNILDFTNIIFENIMSNKLGDIDYVEEEYLNLGANYPDNIKDTKIELNIINTKEIEEQDIYDNNEEIDNIEDIERIEDVELEASFVASKIKKLIDSKYQVWDRNKNKYRDITYKDIVILLRSTSQTAHIYEKKIAELEIPVFSDSSQEYLESTEIQTIMNLLKVIDNPMQDIPLVSVLRSPIGGFTDNELIQMRLTDRYDSFYICMKKSKIDVERELRKKINSFLDNLDKWRKEQEYLSLDEFIWKLYTDTGYYNYVGLMNNGNLRQANLKMLFQRAKQYETSNFKGLYHFIRFIDQLKLNSGDLSSAKLIGENDDVVRIMSIHKSKGLEFPVVFLSSTGKQFNLMDLNQNILLHQDLGIGVKYIDYDKQIQYDTLTKVALRSKILAETLSEEMRVLYVALTRAKEKLFITGISKDFDKELEKIKNQISQYTKEEGKINPILIKKYKTYLSWILLVYYYEESSIKNFVDISIYTKKDLVSLLTKQEKEDIDIIEIIEKIKLDKNELLKIEKVLNNNYKYQESTTMPTMASVTQIKHMKDNIEDMENLEFDQPKFLKHEEDIKLTSAQKGTLVHLCLQKLNEKIDYELKDIKNLIHELMEKEIITKKEAENINPFTILKFTQSNIWKELKKAKEIYREKPFYMNVSSKDIYSEKESDEEVLVQGIIDLYYINEKNELILVDYKTDYVESGKEEELIEKYSNQLEMYAKALEESENKKVAKKIIYSTSLGKEIYLT